MTLRTVSDTLSEYPNSTVTFYRREATFDENEASPPFKVSVETDEDGAYTIDLKPNTEWLTYNTYLVIYPGKMSHEFILEPGDPITMPEILILDVDHDWTADIAQTMLDILQAQYASQTGNSGSWLIGYLANVAGAYGSTLRDRLDQDLVFMDFVPPAERAAIEAGTSTYDASTELATFATAMATTGKQGRLPAGRIQFSTGFTVTIGELTGEGDDQTLLYYTGTGYGVTVANSGTSNGLSGFKVLGTASGMAGIYMAEGESSRTTLSNLRSWGFSTGYGVLFEAASLDGNYYSMPQNIHCRDNRVGCGIITTGYVTAAENPDLLPVDVEATRVRFNNMHLMMGVRCNYNSEYGFEFRGASGHILVGCSAEHNGIHAFRIIGSTAITVLGGWYEHNLSGHVWVDEYSRGIGAIGAVLSGGSRSQPVLPVVGPGANRSGNFFIFDYTRSDMTNYTEDTWRELNYTGWVEALRFATLYVTGSAYIDVIRPRSAIFNQEYSNAIVSRYRRGPRTQYTTLTASAALGATQITVSNTDTEAVALAGFPLTGQIKIEQDENNAETTSVTAAVDNGNGTTTLTLAAPLSGTATAGNQAKVTTQLEDTIDRLTLRNSGEMAWSAGSSSADTFLERVSSGFLKVTSTLQALHLYETGARYRKRTGTSADLTADPATHALIAVTSTNVPKTITLPAANSVGASNTLAVSMTVKDESGGAATNNITVVVSGGGTIDGAASNVISTNYGARTYYSTGSAWFTI